MAEQTRAPRLAVLIDADNASPKLSDELFKEIARIGEASVRRIYGDFSAPQMSSWLKVMPEQAIIPQMNIANTTGKNASDIALVIDAMDLLHSERFDGFCLVSSDSDFTRLAARIRSRGLPFTALAKRKRRRVLFRPVSGLSIQKISCARLLRKMRQRRRSRMMMGR